MKKNGNEMREFIRGIVLIGLPIMVQTLVNSLVNMLDVFMVGQLGEIAITASSLGNSWFFMYALLIGGITAAGSIFIAQNWGAKQAEEIHKYMGIMFVGTLMSLFLNMLLNYMLIFRHFGMPKLGITGAAAATLIARIVELLFIAGYVFGKKSVIAANLRTYFSFGQKQLREYVKYGFFVVLGECIYAVGTSVYNVAYKYTGTEAQAALQIVSSLNNLAMVTAIGIGQSAGVVIGKLLGRNELDKAKRFCNMYLLFSALFSLIMAVLVVLAEPLYVSFFQIGSQAKEYVMKMVWILAVTLPIRGVNFTIVTGILRSG